MLGKKSILYCLDKTSFRFLTMLCRTDNIMSNIPHVQTECGDYSIKLSIPHTIVMDLNNVMDTLFNCYG